ncbi:MAG: diguanylate cyclase [Bdellovibrionales bacterium]|nr:diguanylate cyclase [Bdellovibrionales bacterium]
MSEKTIIKHKSQTLDEKKVQKHPCLIVLQGLYVGEVFQLDEPVMVLGRDREAQIVIMEDGISRQHARFEINDENIFLMDLGSTNGTSVNGARIKGQIQLRDGDKIQIGDVLLKFSFQDEIDVHHHASMREMAMKDPLTQIYNRRYFMDLFHREVSYASRQGQPLGCLLFDVDHFKKVNDTYGHQAGDLVLKLIAKNVSGTLRVYDAFARYGGEEFVIMLRTTTPENAVMIAERIRKLVENLVIEFDKEVIPITISLGVSSFDGSQMLTADELLQIADDNLYKAKEKGRNCVVS